MKCYLNHREKNLHRNVCKTYTLQWCVSQPLPLESDKKVCNKPDNDRSCWLLVHVFILVCQDCSYIYIRSVRVEVVEVTLVGDCTHWCKLNRDRVDTRAGLGLNISMLKSPRSKISL